jgi:hypothetical protein
MILTEVAKMNNPKDRADSLQKLMPYIYPQLSAMQVEVNSTSEQGSALAKISNEDLVARAKLILERGINGTADTTTAMEPTSPTTGGDSDPEGYSYSAGIGNENEDGENQ